MITTAIKEAACARVAAVFGVTRESIVGRGRTGTVALARQAAMVLLVDQGYTTVEVGRVFYRDHGTVVHAIKAVEYQRAHARRAIREKLEAVFAEQPEEVY